MRRLMGVGCVLMFLGSAVSNLGAVEVREGRIRIVLHESTGRFSLYYLYDIQRDREIPLLFDRDPRTSVLSILEDNRIHRMGDAAAFSGTAERTRNGARFRWQSAALEVEQEFRPVASDGSELADGVIMTIRIRNVSERDRSVAVRLLLDTYLGEEDSLHFRTAETDRIQRETNIRPAPDVPHWVSPSGALQGVGLQFMMTGPGITEPERVILANWKRLADAPWRYEPNPSRGFNLLPYSINDSAAAVYYPQVRLARSEVHEIVAVMGNVSPLGFSAIETERGELARLFEDTVSEERIEPRDVEDLYGDLVRIEDVLAQINRLLDSDEEISDEDLAVIERVLQGLRRRVPDGTGQ